MAQKDELLILSCPYAIQGCTFSTQSEADLKTHLRECQYFMNEYIKEFLQKKKQELEKENKTEQAQLIDQAIQKHPTNHQSEYLSDMVVNASKSMWGYVANGFSKLSADLHGSEILPKAKDTIGKTMETVSSTFSDTSSTIWNTTGQLTHDMEIVSTVSEVMQELKTELTGAITALTQPPPEDYHPLSQSTVNTNQLRHVHFSDTATTIEPIQEDAMQFLPLSPQQMHTDTVSNNDEPSKFEQLQQQQIKRSESDMDEISLEEALLAEQLPDVTSELLKDLRQNKSNDNIDIEAILQEAEEDSFV